MSALKSKKKDFSKIIVALVIALNVIFSGLVLYVFVKTGSEPSTLIGCWFAFTTGELWALSKVKRDKINKGDSE